MRPLKLAVLFDERIQSGGGYQQALNAALLVKRLPADLVDPVFFTTEAENVNVLAEHGIEARVLSLSAWARLTVRARRLVRSQPILRTLQAVREYNAFEREFVDHGVDLVYFLSPTGLACDLERLNYIITVWDLCHRDAPEFPEVRADRTFEKREAFYRGVLPRSIAILVDSPLGKTNVLRRYGLDEQRVHVMPFAPAARSLAKDDGTKTIDVAKKYDLTDPYVLYPGQFWAHKNHVYLLRGLRILEDSFGHRIGAVFCGRDKGNLEHVRRTCEELRLSERVRFAGFVPDEEIPDLYRQAVALVMPTYFGPTNLPPLEAFRLGVPVLYSDLDGLRDQVSDAALLMDLTDPTSMASHLDALLTRDDLRKSMIEKGKVLIGQMEDADRVKVLREMLEEFRHRRACWR